jgi:hypothetical protein
MQEELKNYSSSQTGGPADGREPADAVSSAPERPQATEALVELGMPRPLAQAYAALDPGLVLAAGDYLRQRLQDRTLKPIINRVGFLRHVLEHPEESGFERTETGWQRPPVEGKAARIEARRGERQKAEARRRQEEADREAQRLRDEEIYRQRRSLWESLAEGEREAIRQGIRRHPLFVSRGEDSWLFTQQCHAEAERLTREKQNGQLTGDPHRSSLSASRR